MKKVYLYLIISFMLASSSYGQSFNIGLRFEGFAYFVDYTRKPSGVQFMPIPLFSGYLKAGMLIYDKYEIELKGGLQLIDPFVGVEYAFLFKYNIVEKIFPLVTYLNHFNGGDSRVTNGTYGNRMDFIGIGAEAEITKLFSLDIIFYIPISKKDLEFKYDLSTNKKITTSKMGPMIKLGFILNIIRL